MRALQTPLGAPLCDLDAFPVTPSLASRALLPSRSLRRAHFGNEIAHTFKRFAGQHAKSTTGRYYASFACTGRLARCNGHRCLRCACPRGAHTTRVRVIHVIGGVIIAGLVTDAEFIYTRVVPPVLMNACILVLPYTLPMSATVGTTGAPPEIISAHRLEDAAAARAVPLRFVDLHGAFAVDAVVQSATGGEQDVRAFSGDRRTAIRGLRK